MENCGHLPAEVSRVLERFVHGSTAIFPYAGPQRGLQMSVDICGHLCGRLHGWVRTSVDVRMDGCGCLRKSACTGADICKAKGSVRVAPPAV